MSNNTDDRYENDVPYDDVLDPDGEPIEPTDLDDLLAELEA